MFNIKGPGGLLASCVSFKGLTLLSAAISIHFLWEIFQWRPVLVDITKPAFSSTPPIAATISDLERNADILNVWCLILRDRVGLPPVLLLRAWYWFVCSCVLPASLTHAKPNQCQQQSPSLSVLQVWKQLPLFGTWRPHRTGLTSDVHI